MTQTRNGSEPLHRGQQRLRLEGALVPARSGASFPGRLTSPPAILRSARCSPWTRSGRQWTSIRILMGDEVSLRTKRAFAAGADTDSRASWTTASRRRRSRMTSWRACRPSLRPSGRGRFSAGSIARTSSTPRPTSPTARAAVIGSFGPGGVVATSPIPG